MCSACDKTPSSCLLLTHFGVLLATIHLFPAPAPRLDDRRPYAAQSIPPVAPTGA